MTLATVATINSRLTLRFLIRIPFHLFLSHESPGEISEAVIFDRQTPPALRSGADKHEVFQYQKPGANDKKAKNEEK
jgi:hypothetical protein